MLLSAVLFLTGLGSLASFFFIPGLCRRKTSSICAPIRKTGFREVMGS
jgi:hypothetical protein